MLEEDSNSRAQREGEKRELRVCVFAKKKKHEFVDNHCVVELTGQISWFVFLLFCKQKQKRMQRQLAPDKEAEDGSKSAKKNPLG